MYATTDTWQVSDARKQLSDVIEAAAAQPQRLLRHGRLVAVLVSPDDFEAFQAWKARRAGTGAALVELSQVCAEEGYELYVSERRDRPTPFDPGFPALDGPLGPGSSSGGPTAG
jgi:prevent-host-death family protein